MKDKLEKYKKELQDLINTQSADGNWNYDPYMQGMANGLICAMSVLTGEEPVYKSAPKQWGHELPDSPILETQAELNQCE